ncbi:sulfotransferase family protein [Sinorhizobium numidicum]|uniref:Sulfotransferase family protein n=1 Tax=Sinorhizobium numidicum TaxID=680248 RepID=A0ABY8CMS9_9HYPH|nr:sulfotransferase family 2 domain-containing protein [Sinorhizobium numidicum]WEX73985.1 sulfotransferase family protein [Sinorhizobium numidicum]WEX79970.1 sulfotransferase family protein [Sinorhizobium numidicum]
MIISHRHKFIFVHVPKNAGSTIAAYLARDLGPRDLQLGSWKDALGNGAKANRLALTAILRHHSPLEIARTLIRNGKLDPLAGDALSRRFAGKLWDHSGASEIEAFDPSAWKHYFKFCFVRNPFERAVSVYNWHYRKAETRPSFSQMLCLIEEGAAKTERINWESWQLYTKNDEIVVDFVGRQERLADDLSIICDRLGMRFDERFLIKAKASPRRVDIRSYYKPGDRERIERLFGPEIEHFKYRFPD